MTTSALEAWFMREVRPLEATRMQYLRQNFRDASAAEDLLHDVYVRVSEAARETTGISERGSQSSFPE